MEAEQIQEATLDQLLDARLKADQQIEDLQASISVINTEMIARLDADKEKAKVVGSHTVSKVTRLNFKPTIDQARELAATKTVEQIDTQALKRLHESGVEIPNTSITVFCMVRPVEQKTTE
ncbi:MAG TPA: hypothetical protein VE090_02580 [Methylomirabilota bacterium]|nr:hypothetical protein [Methylomirabilota bacterium]